MRTTFALFQKYEDAKKVVDGLLDKNFKKDEINIIAQKSAIENAWNINERTIGVAVTDKEVVYKDGANKDVAKQNVQGLDAMLGRLQPIRTYSAGEIYASGEIAKIVAKTASVPGAAAGGLKGALVDLGVDEGPASKYDDGIRNGQLLVFVRSMDERSAEAKETLSESPAKHLGTFLG